jgi:hypothetical protein
MAESEFKNILEKSAFGVCTYIGEKMGIAKTLLYLSFVRNPWILYPHVSLLGILGQYQKVLEKE